MVDCINSFDRRDIKNAYTSMYSRRLNESIADNMADDCCDVGGDEDDCASVNPVHHVVVFKKIVNPIGDGEAQIVAWFPKERGLFTRKYGYCSAGDEIDYSTLPNADEEEYLDLLDELRRDYREADGDFLDVESPTVACVTDDCGLEADYNECKEMK